MTRPYLFRLFTPTVDVGGLILVIMFLLANASPNGLPIIVAPNVSLTPKYYLIR